MTKREAALAYAARGWRVFPLRSILDGGGCSCRKECSSPGKHPLINAWQDKATTDPVQVEVWWGKWPTANVGIATGAGSGIVVVDVDPRHGGDGSLAKLDLPATYTVQTGGGGLHLYFQHPGREVRNSASEIAPGIDVRGDGGYVIAPPSNHASGGDYAILEDRDLAPFPAKFLGKGDASEPGQKEAADFPEIVKEGSRNNFLASEAGKLRHLGLEADELFAKLLTINAARCEPPLGDDEVRRVAASIARYDLILPLTDLGNAERFAAQHGESVRYCAQQRSWYVWDSRRWRFDVIQKAKLLATFTVRSIYKEAAAAEDSDTLKAIAKHANASEGAGRISALLTLAQIQASLAIRADVLDTDPWLLNVLNGTLDLRTGELRPHQPQDLMTKLAPVAYDPDARSELWDAFLRDVTGGDDELTVYLQRAAGYSLTGSVDEHAVFFVYGPPATGKSRFTGAVKDMLGDYAIQTAFDTFLATRFGGGGSNDIADLAGARLVLATEADRGRRFAEARLKHLTGGDTVRARQLYERNFEFKPQFKLWLAANDAPRVNNDDEGMFRRMNIVPFTHIVPEEKRDKHLGDKLAMPEARSAILAWAIRGCLEWQQDGLRAPRLVSDATAQYRDEQDPLQYFLDEWCDLALDRTIPKAKLWQAYLAWAKSDSLRFPLTRHEFTTRIAKMPQIKDRRATGGTRIWVGIDVREGWMPTAAPR